jgi:hypothetical protein
VTDTIAGGSVVRRTDFTGVDFAFTKINSPANPGDNFVGTGWDSSLRNIPGDILRHV